MREYRILPDEEMQKQNGYRDLVRASEKHPHRGYIGKIKY